MIAGQLDLLDALAEPEPAHAPAPRRPAADMTRCRRCQRPATGRVTNSRNLLLLGVAGSALAATFRDLVTDIPVCDQDAAWYVALAAPAGTAAPCRARLATWTTETR